METVLLGLGLLRVLQATGAAHVHRIFCGSNCKLIGPSPGSVAAGIMSALLEVGLIIVRVTHLHCAQLLAQNAADPVFGVTDSFYAGVVDEESAAWYRGAVVAVLTPLGKAESDFHIAYRGGRRTALVEACNHLIAAATAAESWIAAHPCPSSEIDAHVQGQVRAIRDLVRCMTSIPINPALEDRTDFHIANLQHKLLWHRTAIATWAERPDE